jgi:hypothetical protein
MDIQNIQGHAAWSRTCCVAMDNDMNNDMAVDLDIDYLYPTGKWGRLRGGGNEGGPGDKPFAFIL